MRNTKHACFVCGETSYSAPQADVDRVDAHVEPLPGGWTLHAERNKPACPECSVLLEGVEEFQRRVREANGYPLYINREIAQGRAPRFVALLGDTLREVVIRDIERKGVEISVHTRDKEGSNDFTMFVKWGEVDQTRSLLHLIGNALLHTAELLGEHGPCDPWFSRGRLEQ